jgi:hypothetical protein
MHISCCLDGRLTLHAVCDLRCRYMTWDSRLFPNPVQMQEDIASRCASLKVWLLW